MKVIRRGVEAVFDHFEKFQQPAGYSTDLRHIPQSLAQVTQHLQTVEKSPILKDGPEHYARAIERSGQSLVKTAVQQFQNESRDFQRVARAMAEQMNSARLRRTQNQWLGVIGLAGGILATLFLPSALPCFISTRDHCLIKHRINSALPAYLMFRSKVLRVSMTAVGIPLQSGRNLHDNIQSGRLSRRRSKFCGHGRAIAKIS